MATTPHQQMIALIYRLENHQFSQNEIAFYDTLSDLSFDYQQPSLQTLNNLLNNLSEEINLKQFLSTPNIDRFLFSIAGYIVNYLAISTAETLHWLSYEEALVEISHKNKQYGIHARLERTLENSIIGQIGDTVFCQPIQIMLDHWRQPNSILNYVNDMKKVIFNHQKINLKLDANTVSQHYLSKVRTGYLLDENFGFYQTLKSFKFDFTMASLSQLDTILTSIQTNNFQNAQTTIETFNTPAFQSTIRLLGFYIASTIARSVQTFMRWINHTQAQSLFNYPVTKTLGNEFIVLINNNSYLPMQVVLEYFVGDTSVRPIEQFIKTIHNDITAQKNAPKLITSYYHPEPIENVKQLPEYWQLACVATGMLLSRSLKILAKGEKLTARAFEYDPQQNTGKIISLEDIVFDNNTSNEYQKISYLADKNPKQLIYFAAVCDGFLNLPEGSTDALLIKIKVYTQPQLEIEFFLPYRAANERKGFSFYNLIYDTNQLTTELRSQPKLLQTITNVIMYSLAHHSSQASNFFTDYWISQFDLDAKAPKLSHLTQINSQIAFDLTLLPLNSTQLNQSQTLEQTSETASLIPFHPLISRLQPHQYEYLQVIVPTWLKKDYLFSQIAAMPQLYQTGHIVWCSLIWANNLTSDIQQNDCIGDVVYDPLGKTPLHELKFYAQKLIALKGKKPTQPDQQFYATHLNSPTSRIFDLPYPKSLAAVNLRISSIWFWRMHLPNGMLSESIFPIIISWQTQGRVMVLPARFWKKSFYQAWLEKAQNQLHQHDSFDLMPMIEQNEAAGTLLTGKQITEQQINGDIMPPFQTLLAVSRALSPNKNTQASVGQGYRKSAYSQFNQYKITQKPR